MIFSLAFGWAVIYINRTCLYPLFPAIAQTLEITSAQAGFLSSFYYIFYTILQIPGGFLMDRLGTRKCLVAGSIFSGLSLLGIAFWKESYSALLFFLALQGAGDSFFYAGAQASIVAYARPEKKTFYSALVGMGMSVGILAGLGIAQPLYNYFGGYRMPFFFLGILTFGASFFLFRCLPNVPLLPSKKLPDYRALFTDKELWKISLAVFCLMYGFWVLLNWGPTFLRLERNFVAEHAGFYSGLAALAALPGSIFWSRLSERLGRKFVVMLSFPLSSFFLFSIAYIQSVPLLVASLLAFGFCTNAAVVPVAVTWISRIAVGRYPGQTAVVIAFFNTIIIASAIAAPALSGFIRDISGSLVGAIYFGAGLILLGPLLVCRLKESRDFF